MSELEDKMPRDFEDHCWKEFFDGLDEDQGIIRKEILGPSWAPRKKTILVPI